MPDMNENAETQQEYFGVRTDNKRTLCNALKRIEELEEKLANADYQLEGRDLEIKELKEKLNFSTQYYQGEKAKEQLTKAKEIIRTFLGFAEAFGYSPSMDKFITEAEQFISEVEK